MQFAREHPELNVIGLGALDSRELADEFIAATGTGGGELTMVWEPSGASRNAFGVRSQPYWLFYDANGNEITSRPGVIDTELLASFL